MAPLRVFVYREVAPDIWDTRHIPETRLQAFIDQGWHILIGEDDIRRQIVEDQFRQHGQPLE